jgi:hypothetical protein
MTDRIVRGSLAAIVMGAAAAMLSAGPLSAQTKAEGEALLPPDAKPGECYARIFIPPSVETSTEQVLTREESERVEITPARYETVMEKVVVTPASTAIKVVPAVYGFENERILVRPASKRLVEIRAVYATVTERVIEKPAHTVWKKGRGPIQKVDNATGEIMCLVEVPATYKTVTRRVVKTPASSREVEVPAQYTTVRKRVEKSPATTREVEIPAKYKTVPVTRLVAPAEERRVPVPALYEAVTKSVQVSEGRVEWLPILCETNATRTTVKEIQRALRRAKHDPGAIDGVLGRSTMNAVRSFQKSKGLPTGQLTMETIKALGVSF